MRYAILSDIHANLEALQAVLDAIKTLNVDKIIYLGDLVGYNPNPVECIELIMMENAEGVLGNHDEIACELDEPWNFNRLALKAALWTRSRLGEREKSYLRKLPRKKYIDGSFLLMHGSVFSIDEYILTKELAMENIMWMKKEGIRLAFFGHTHIRIAFAYDDEGFQINLSDEIELSPSGIYLINPGSVGQPRDFDPRASFLVYDPDEQIIRFHRVEYDIDGCYEKIIREGLDRRLGLRLYEGR